MKHPYIRLAAVYLCLLAAFSLGLGELLLADKSERPSYTENRMLQAFPTLSAGTLLDGSFMADFESWLSDAFFFRDGAAAFSDGTRGLFSLRSETPALTPQAQTWAMDDEQQQELEELIGEIAEDPLPTAAPAAEEAQPMTTAAPVAADSAEACRRPTPEVTQSASFWTEKADGRRVTVESYSADHIATLARVLNEYRAALPADGTVSFMSPMVADLANTVLREHNAVDWGCDLDEVIRPFLDEGVRFYDQADILRPYVGTGTLYPTIDHHWHPISAKIELMAGFHKDLILGLHAGQLLVELIQGRLQLGDLLPVLLRLMEEQVHLQAF